ncbi:exo-alpha-sialidase [Nocardioides hungaricus]
MSDTTLMMVGTRKGLWLGTSDEAREEWEFTGPHFDMEKVYSCLVDKRGTESGGTPRLLAGASSPWLGPQVRRSDDLGASWQETPNGAVRFPDGTDAKVERIWQLVPGCAEGVVYAGTEPAAVWRSTDRGETFALEQALWDHPHRADWGAGFGGQAFHTILPHPTDPLKVTAALSSGGVYQTDDGGQSWTARNHGIRAEFLPEGQQYPEFGQCVHKITRHPSRPERLFLQNHGGVYRSDDEGVTWTSIADGLPADFGFPIVVHPHEPDTVYVFPLGGSGGRYPPEARARVWRSRNAGDTWEELGGQRGDGLPDEFYVAVMRDAMCADDHERTGLYFGARNGAVWGSADEGATWRQVITDLPDVMCVRAAAV